LQICSLEEAQIELSPIRSKNSDYVGPAKTKLAGRCVNSPAHSTTSSQQSAPDRPMQEASRLPSDSAPRLAKSTPPIQRESGPALPSLASRLANSTPPSARLRSRRRPAPSARRHPSSPLAALDVTPATTPPNRAAHRPVVPLWDPASMASGAGRSVLARRRGVVGECGGLGRGECAEPDADPLDEVADLGGPLAPRAAPDALVLRRLPAAARHRRGLLLLIPRRLHPRLPGLSERRFLDQAHGFTRLYEVCSPAIRFLPFFIFLSTLSQIGKFPIRYKKNRSGSRTWRLGSNSTPSATKGELPFNMIDCDFKSSRGNGPSRNRKEEIHTRPHCPTWLSSSRSRWFW
jgi:hypothetical protein